MADALDAQKRLTEAIRMTAPGTALRTALDMIIAGHLGALICIGDVEKVLACGNDGFQLNVPFTAMRLFELSKMDGAIVIDEGSNQILRANFHLNPDPNVPTSETGMRHRTASRMSLMTDAIVVSVSERRQQINVYVYGRSITLRSTEDLGNEVNQLVVSLQTSRNSLDVLLSRLTRLEFENYVTLADITRVYGGFQLVHQAAMQLEALLPQLGSEDKLVRHYIEQLSGGMDNEYLLAVRDYAANSSADQARRIIREFDTLTPREMASPARVAHILGYDDLREDSVVTPLGLRTLSRSTGVPNETVETIVGEYGSLPALMNVAETAPEKLGDIGVSNPHIFVDSLLRLWGKKG
ncbi:MAG: DNA integrity scanning diadenylate cyclase DisA [Coriobacteriales bacterium]|nr:DNA integrity scanning diadenylate cyclase DisA [Coriobacteriales bacterium]